MFDGKWSSDGTMLEFTRLTKRMTPNWSSGKRINVSKELAAAFKRDDTPEVDTSPQPNAPVTPQATAENATTDKTPAASAAGGIAAAIGAGAAAEQVAPGWGFWAGLGVGVALMAVLAVVIFVLNRRQS